MARYSNHWLGIQITGKTPPLLLASAASGCHVLTPSSANHTALNPPLLRHAERYEIEPRSKCPVPSGSPLNRSSTCSDIGPAQPHSNGIIVMGPLNPTQTALLPSTQRGYGGTTLAWHFFDFLNWPFGPEWLSIHEISRKGFYTTIFTLAKKSTSRTHRDISASAVVFFREG